MNYAEETWIKVYTRDSAGWLATSWQARGLALELARKLERGTGEVSLGRRGLEAVAALIRAPWDEIRPYLEELLDEGRYVYDAERQVLCDPEHPARQGAATTGAERTRRWREKAKAASSAPDAAAVQAPAAPPSGVTSRDAAVTSRDAAVTSRDEEREKKEKKEETERETRARATPVLPVLDTPIPERFRLIADGIAMNTGAALDIDAAWTGYVAWCVEERRPLSEARWQRWASGDASRARERRLRLASTRRPQDIVQSAIEGSWSMPGGMP